MSRKKLKTSSHLSKKRAKTLDINKRSTNDSRGITGHQRMPLSDMLWDYYWEIRKKKI